MSLNREMLQVARLSPRALGDAADLVAEFLQSLQNDDGGFAGRSGSSDLYYTSFAVSGLVALQRPLPVESLGRYVASFAAGEELDLVHRCCLARISALLPPDQQLQDRARLLQQVESLRTPDGGYSAVPGAPRGTLYGCFLALGAYQDLNQPMPAAERMLDCIRSLKTADGGYANSSDLPLGLTPTSAAAATLLRQLGAAPDAGLGRWFLERLHREGGFAATPEAPMPDLLSTATALHALAAMEIEFTPFREACLDFVDTLWTARGGFYGTWEDDHLDCEYTYYGLLALGHLSV